MSRTHTLRPGSEFFDHTRDCEGEGTPLRQRRMPRWRRKRSSRWPGVTAAQSRARRREAATTAPASALPNSIIAITTKERTRSSMRHHATTIRNETMSIAIRSIDHGVLSARETHLVDHEIADAVRKDAPHRAVKTQEGQTDGRTKRRADEHAFAR